MFSQGYFAVAGDMAPSGEIQQRTRAQDKEFFFPAVFLQQPT